MSVQPDGVSRLSADDVERLVQIDRILSEWLPETTSGIRLQISFEIAALPAF